MKLFNEGSLQEMLENHRKKARTEIESQDKNYLLNANESQLVQHFTDKYSLEQLIIHLDKVYVSDREELIPAERFDSFRFNVESGGKYRKQVVTYHAPFLG